MRVLLQVAVENSGQLTRTRPVPAGQGQHSPRSEVSLADPLSSPGMEAVEIVISVLLFMVLVAIVFLICRRMRNSQRGLNERIRPFILTPLSRPHMQERPDPYDPPYDDPYDPSHQYVLVHNDKRSSIGTTRTSPTLFVTDESRTQATMGRQRQLPKLPRLHILHSPPSSWHSRNRSAATLATSLLPRTGEEARPRGDLNV